VYAFEYHRPESVAAAATLLRELDEAKLLAGGQTLIPTMKLRLAAPGHIVDLGRVAGLTDIQVDDRAVAIGALVTHRAVARSANIKRVLPALAEMAGMIGDPAVRARGTIGGSIANNDPAADYPAACLGLGATIVTNEREIAADDYFKGMFQTALKAGEIITRVSFPVPSKAAYMKFYNPASRFALVGVFVAKAASGVRVAVTGAGSNGVFRASALEQALSTMFAPEELEGIKISEDGLNTDIHADTEYRAHLIGVLTRRAVGAGAARLTRPELPPD
jgi:aerobic carbon-monoxide dehydrogenase medium subunit